MSCLVLSVSSNNFVFYSFVCPFFIVFTSAFFFFHSSFSNFLVWVIFYIFGPSLYISQLLTLLFCFSNDSQLYFLASTHMIISICVSYFWFQFLPDPTGKHLFTGQEFPPFPSVSLVIFCLLPSILSFSLHLSIHSLLSSTSSVLLSSVQLHSNPGRQQDLELTGEMRWWNGMTSVVRMCVCVSC